MAIIGVDPSLISTAITIKNDDGYQFHAFYRDYKPNNKWCKMFSNFITFHEINFFKDSNFSKNEILKLRAYDEITDQITDVIVNNLDDDYNKINIEGYSQSSKAGMVQDLVTFGTLLRYKLHKFEKNIEIIPPLSLKKRSADLVYEKDNKGTARNKDGISGGRFTKWDMYKMIIDSDYISDIKSFIEKHNGLMCDLKSVPKPLEDVIDSYFLNILN